MSRIEMNSEDAASLCHLQGRVLEWCADIMEWMSDNNINAPDRFHDEIRDIVVESKRVSKAFEEELEGYDGTD